MLASTNQLANPVELQPSSLKISTAPAEAKDEPASPALRPKRPPHKIKIKKKTKAKGEEAISL